MLFKIQPCNQLDEQFCTRLLNLRTHTSAFCCAVDRLLWTYWPILRPTTCFFKIRTTESGKRPVIVSLYCVLPTWTFLNSKTSLHVLFPKIRQFGFQYRVVQDSQQEIPETLKKLHWRTLNNTSVYKPNCDQSSAAILCYDSSHCSDINICFTVHIRHACAPLMPEFSFALYVEKNRARDQVMSVLHYPHRLHM